MNKIISVLIGYLISVNLAYANIEDYKQYQQNNGLRTFVRVYDECSKIDGAFMTCLKKKAITFIDRIENIDTINISDGINLIRSQNAQPIGRRITENELELELSRGIDDQNNQLTAMLIERITTFFNDHTLKINFPKVTADEFGKSLEEGRGKMKKMMGMMMMGMAMKMMGMIPVAMAGLYMMAGKALIVSKIALLLAGIMGLKKLMSGKGGGGGGGGAGWSAGGGGGGSGWSSGGGNGGWDRRSINEGQNLAYRGYNEKIPTEQNPEDVNQSH